MSAYRFVTITCDECGEIWDEGMTTSIRTARAWAHKDGWHYGTDRGDTCPLHNGYQRTPLGDGYERAGR